MYVCMYVCMHACMYVRMYVCVYVCAYVCIYVCMYVGSQNQYANTMCIGEWQRPVLAPCAMWPSSARRPSWERTVCCRRLVNELRRGTWQVRQVRQQQHAWTTKRCIDSWLVGELATGKARVSGAAIGINGSFSRQIETCSTDKPSAVSATPATQSERPCRQDPPPLKMYGERGVRGNNRVYVIVPFLAFIQWKIARFMKLIKGNKSITWDFHFIH